MDDMNEYMLAVADLLAATIREVEVRKELTAACAAEIDTAMSSAMTQQKRLAVYAAEEAREEAAERYVIRWRRIGKPLTDEAVTA